MTTKPIAVVLGISCVLALGACDRDDIDPAENSADLRTRELPAEVAVRERVAAEERAERGEPSEAKTPTEPQAEATDQRPARAPSTLTTAAESATPRRAQVELDTVGKAELDVKASFVEQPDGVAVIVNVEDAKPGTRSVRIFDRESCDDLEKGLGRPLDSVIKDGSLGSVTIGQSGKGTLETKAPSSTLKPDDRASLLGKAIVVQERSDGDSAKAAGDALACGVIRMDTGLADKAGRMTAPTN
jgi:Cu/Zn superoxide dismutase